MASPSRIMRFGVLSLYGALLLAPSEALSPSSPTEDYTDGELAFEHSLDWCTDGRPIQWVDKDQSEVDARIAAGARPAPERDAKGRIADLGAFVDDRLSTLPPGAVEDDLPAMIVENGCASVDGASDECAFDYDATPAPFQWASHEYFTGDVPPSIQNWEANDLTVVYAPTSDSSKDAKEITRVETAESSGDLARMHVRGNSSRKIPKKQFALKLPKAETLIPGGAKAKKWVMSAYMADNSYIDNKVVFDAYTRFGDLQREFINGWPEGGSVEDMATRAFAPRSNMVNLVFQGRYAGIYYLMDRVEAREGRVWLPKSRKDDSYEAGEARVVDGIELPIGSYLLSRDWSNSVKGLGNPDRDSEAPANGGDEASSTSVGLLVPNMHNYSDALFELMIGSTTPMEWTIMRPKDRSFADSETDQDISLLRGFLLQLQLWLKDPIGNNDILSSVIDAKSMARWFLLQEFAKEHDGYVASMYFKVVGGKLYHASPWDYAGTSFMTTSCNSPLVINPLTIDRETNTYSTRPPCDESTGNMATAGWWVNSIYNLFEESVCEMLEGEMGQVYGFDCAEGKHTLSDLKWFFGNIFRMPALQEEFWMLWDTVLEHGLVGKKGSDSGDLFSADLLADKIFEPIRNTVEADRQIWYSTLQRYNITLNTSSIDPGTCQPLLEDSLRKSKTGNDPIPDAFTVPRNNWAFQTAYENGEFISFWKGLVAEKPIDGLSDFIDSDYVLAKKRKFFKCRLEWIMSQHPGNGDVDSSQTSSSSPDSKPGGSMFHPVKIAVIALPAVLIASAKWFRRDYRLNYSPVANVELE